VIVHPNFDPVAISIGPLSIHWYGLMYLLGFAAGVMLGQYRAKLSQSNLRTDNPADRWTTEEVVDMLFYIALGVIAGGRLGYVLFYNLEFYLSNPLDMFAIWDGGMSFHGGMLGVFCAIFWFARKTGRRFFTVSDYLAPLIPPGLFFGRIGNFINQELWGRTTDLPWGIWFHTVPGFARHPSQLYEAILEGLALFVLLWWFSSRPRNLGQISGLFVLGYGCFRFFVEFFREPDGHIGAVLLNWMTMGQILSIPMIILGVYLMVRKAPEKLV
jgi:phosphatidylglycerol:prolipoprotein diacylglycerol transferase